MWLASSLSFSIFGLSSIMNIRSKRDKIVEGRSICSAIDLYWSKRPNLGLAAAKTEHLEFNVAIIPALAMLIVCCSRASCMADRSSGRILSNSSTQTLPLSPSTSAPASKLHPPNSSLTAAAVSPTPLVPLPLV
ncbi:MAG: hypothetical protein A4E27_01236 [Methanobacterium sp. PtaU1.Bin242]|nr:MAG: hypothetical protein A4E27_01236 [Methanobacterium sp. PtaU1.Bin242]